MLGPLEEILSKPEHATVRSNRELVEVAHRNGTRLLKLVNTLLDFSRIEAGRVRVIYRPTDLCNVTADLASLFRSATDRAGLKLVVDCPPLSQPVFVDREMWEKIVLNLLSNAFKFTFDGSIAVRLTDRGNSVELSVHDSGVGIPADELPRVFERFHRVEGARGRSFEGSGIGLALVQELVKFHGGSISVQSELGKGTTFRVSIPYGSAHLPRERVYGETSDAANRALAAPYVAEALSWLKAGEPADEISHEILDDMPLPIAVRASSERVLLVDDNRDMRDYVERLLSHYCQVTTAENGRLALQKALADPPNLVLTDVMMPEMNGFDLLSALRSHPETSTIPIILLSARAGDEARIEGLQQGADDYLTKPFSARELLARVRTHLELARVRKNASEEARRRSEQFEILLNQSPLGIFLIDASFRLRQVNPLARAAFGENADELVGRDASEVAHQIWNKD
ncbi:MAG TPA: ATP-binding protein [Candidatus Koribacter sp.]|jgi:CheY-like chemotaxis protein/nitrogen-specific signal transduction histidine kinase